jgi:hypothetical protein
MAIYNDMTLISSFMKTSEVVPMLKEEYIYMYKHTDSKMSS